MATTQAPAKIKELRLPISRVKTIMKSSPHVEAIGSDGLFLVTKATEMFIHHLTEEAYRKNKKLNMLEYKHLAEEVQTNETLEFLKQIMPRKIKVRDFKKLMASKEVIELSSSDDSASDNESEKDTDKSESSNAKSSDDDEDDDKDDSGDDDDDDDDDDNDGDDGDDSNSNSNSNVNGKSDSATSESSDDSDE